MGQEALAQNSINWLKALLSSVLAHLSMTALLRWQKKKRRKVGHQLCTDTT